MVNIDRLIDEKFSYFFLKENEALAKDNGKSIVLFDVIDNNSSYSQLDDLSNYLYSCIINKIKISIELRPFSGKLSLDQLENVYNTRVLSYIESKYLYLIMIEKYKQNHNSLCEMLEIWNTMSLAQKCSKIDLSNYPKRRNIESLITKYHRLIFNQAHPKNV